MITSNIIAIRPLIANSPSLFGYTIFSHNRGTTGILAAIPIQAIIGGTTAPRDFDWDRKWNTKGLIFGLFHFLNKKPEIFGPSFLCSQ
jgi:hypothetical protein